MAESTDDIFRKNHCKTPEWIREPEMPFIDLQIQEFLEFSTNGEQAEMTECSPTSETLQRNDNNSHHSEIECEVINGSQELEDFISAQRSSNTVKKTKSDMRALQRFCSSINETRELEKMTSSELDKLLSKLFKDILAVKRKSLVQSGRGNKPNAARELTVEEQDNLFESGQFGDHDPLVLQRTLWWFLSLHFGFRARDESRKLYWGDVLLQKDAETGRELLVWRTERGPKTRQGNTENGHKRPFSPKLFATGDSRCPVKLYKAFANHRPEDMKKPEDPFYLAVKHKRKSDDNIWYLRTPLGKNQLGKFLSDAVSAAGLQSGKKKLTNHSVRKTSIGRLLDGNFPENYVMQLSGHKNIQSLSSYKSASLGHQRQMSDTLSGRKEPENASTSDINSSIQDSATSVSCSSSSNALEAVFAGANISSISGCTFQVMTGPGSVGCSENAECGVRSAESENAEFVKK
ncbi:hypothetical protein ACROYT_G002414 [Oculina patagonica]